MLSRDPLSLELWKPYDQELGGRLGNGSIVKGLVWPKHRVWCSTAKGTKRMTRVWGGRFLLCACPGITAWDQHARTGRYDNQSEEVGGTGKDGGWR